MENIDIKNTSAFIESRNWIAFWIANLAIIEKKLTSNPDSFFLKGQKENAKSNLKEAIEKFNVNFPTFAPSIT